MFNNLGTGEIIVIALIITVLFGGKKLPELARGIGEANREFRKALNKEDEPQETTTKPKRKAKT